MVIVHHISLAIIWLVLQASAPVSQTSPNTIGTTPLVITYHVRAETSEVPEKLAAIIREGVDPSVRDKLVSPAGVYETANALVIVPAGVRAERKLLSFNGKAAADLKQPTVYPLEQIWVWLRGGGYEEANSSATPPAGIVAGVASTEHRPYPNDLVLDIFLALRGWQMPLPISRDETFTDAREGGRKAFNLTDAKGQHQQWLANAGDESFVDEYRFWPASSDPTRDAPQIVATASEFLTIDGHKYPKKIMWVREGKFAGDLGKMTFTQEITVDNILVGEAALSKAAEIRIAWPKGAKVRVYTAQGERWAAIEEDGQRLDPQKEGL